MEISYLAATQSTGIVLDFTSSFHGVATISDKGQVVIPAAARKAMGLKTGEKLLVFGWGEGTVMLCKVSEMEKYAGYFAQRVEVARTAIEAVGGRLDPPTDVQPKAGKARPEDKAKKGKRRERRSDRRPDGR